MTILYNKKITGCEAISIRNLIKEMMASIKNIIDISEEEEYEYRLILNELITNSTIHGNKCVCDKSIIASIRVINNSYITIKIEDEGQGFNYKEAINRLGEKSRQLSERGRGLMLVSSLCDDVKFNKNGNEVCIKKKI